CKANHSSNHIIEFAIDTTVIGLINDNDERAYREEVNNLAAWSLENNLVLIVNKTTELIIDFRKSNHTHAPTEINAQPAEVVNNFRFLRVLLSSDLTWSSLLS
ncbi:hypothetical protein LDENG_00092710, partial [Lucifuga dentata]